MQDWKPTLNLDADLLQCDLSTEDGFVLSRLDGSTLASQLPVLTGLPPERVQEILRKLVGVGAVKPYRPPAPQPVQAQAQAPAPEPLAEEPPAEEPPAEDAEDEGFSRDEEAADVKSDGTFRKLYETRLHPLPADQRAHRARLAEEPELSAFCFDPLPEVIKALLENPRAGLAHARLVARHHRNPVGLETVTARSSFASDAGVRRWLVRNPQLPVGLFRRLWSGRRLLEHFKLAQDREVAEGTRRAARELLRSRFTAGAPEEKVEVILKTEGRVFANLVGLPIDQRTTSLLCAQSYRSVTLLQNLARWSAAPPLLIGHLLKQEAVRRTPQIRTMLLRHPNAPSHAKQQRPE
jgi:hypothetical protein